MAGNPPQPWVGLRPRRRRRERYGVMSADQRHPHNPRPGDGFTDGYSRTLIYLPIVHTQADMGALKAPVVRATMEKLGRAGLARHQALGGAVDSRTNSSAPITTRCGSAGDWPLMRARSISQMHCPASRIGVASVVSGGQE